MAARQPRTHSGQVAGSWKEVLHPLEEVLGRGLPPLRVEAVTELRHTCRYFGVYVILSREDTGEHYCHGHTSLLHSQKQKRLTGVESRHLLRQACQLLPGLAVEPVQILPRIVHNDEDGRFKRGVCDLREGTQLTHRLWQLRSLLISFLGQGTNEWRTDFHMSFDDL